MSAIPLLCRQGYHKWGEWKMFWNRLTNLQSKSRWCERCPKKQSKKQVVVWRDD